MPQESNPVRAAVATVAAAAAAAAAATSRRPTAAAKDSDSKNNNKSSRKEKGKGDNRFNAPVKTSYESKEVRIPGDFLRGGGAAAAAWDSRGPITHRRVDFAGSPLPQYAGCYAAVLDNVLSPSECDVLRRLAEESVRDEDRVPPANAAAAAGEVGGEGGGGDSDSSWRPALVNAGGGYEVLMTEYRHSDRIIWDSQEVVDRLWARVAAACPAEVVSRPTPAAAAGGGGGGGGGEEDGHGVGGCGAGPGGSFNTLDFPGMCRGAAARRDGGAEWDFHGVNKRLRFLRYGPGQYFRPHCDGEYSTVHAPEDGGDGGVLRTHFTVHIYLNDSRQDQEAQERERKGRRAGGDDEGGDVVVVEEEEEEEEKPRAELLGGATTFLSADEKRRLDVDPRAGRVLIFQHRNLYHCGDDVVEGVKYTVRTDILYKLRGSGGDK